MGKIAKEVAEKEIAVWLDYKRVSDTKRESYKDQIELLVDAISEGVLVVDAETKLLRHYLITPIGKNEEIKSLEYKPRLQVSTVHDCMKGVKATDADGRVLAYVCALTATNSGLIRQLYTDDYSISQSIALFFL
jgi:hypothetical protein